MVSESIFSVSPFWPKDLQSSRLNQAGPTSAMLNYLSLAQKQVNHSRNIHKISLQPYCISKSPVFLTCGAVQGNKPIFMHIGGDTWIQFCLLTIAPDSPICGLRWPLCLGGFRVSNISHMIKSLCTSSLNMNNLDTKRNMVMKLASQMLTACWGSFTVGFWYVHASESACDVWEVLWPRGATTIKTWVPRRAGGGSFSRECTYL